jgi:hypothetical protein
MAVTEIDRLVRAASLSELRAAGRVAANVGDTLARSQTVTRCTPSTTAARIWASRPRGSVADGILTAIGTTPASTSAWWHVDQWADDLQRFPLEVRGDDVYVTSPRAKIALHTTASAYVTA